MRCVLLSSGWYLNATVSIQGAFYVADSLAPQSEFDPGSRFYGPAAWGGKTGPVYGRELIRIRPLHWDSWFALAEANLYEETTHKLEPLRIWPARLHVMSAGRDKGLEALDGVVLKSEADLIVRVNECAERFERRAPLLYTPSGRLQVVKERLSHAGGMAFQC